MKAHLARQDAAQRAKYTGWQPLTIWYTLWAALFGLASVFSLLSGAFGAFLLGAVGTGLIALYAKYLYNGGSRRVWFIIF